MNLTKPQQAIYWRHWAAAERESLPPGATKQERDAFRHEIILRATGCASLRDVDKTTGFDKLMLEVATLAGDYEAAARWGNAAENRLAHMMRECARQIGEIAGDPHGWEYCRDTLRQAGLPQDWQDVPESLLASTFKILDTHRRRLLRNNASWMRRADAPLGFNPDRVYARAGDTLKCYDRQPQPQTVGAGSARPLTQTKG